MCHPIAWSACRPPTAPDTEELVQAFDAVRDRLLRRLHTLLGNAADSQDALQTAFLHCWPACGLGSSCMGNSTTSHSVS